MSMQDYLFFSHAKKIKASSFRFKEDRKRGLQLTQGFKVSAACSSYFNSERFRSEFGPSFDCIEQLAPHQYLVGQFVRADHNHLKTYAVVTFDPETHDHKSQYLPLCAPREGRFYRRKLDGTVYDLHVTEAFLHVRSKRTGKEVVTTRELKQVAYDYSTTSATGAEEWATKQCSTANPQLGQFFLQHFVWVSDDSSLCAFDIVNNHLSIVAFDIDYFLATHSSGMLLFSRSCSILLDVTSFPMSPIVKKEIRRVQEYDQHSQLLEKKEQRFAFNDYLLKRGMYKSVSFMPLSRKEVSVGENQVVTHLQEHEGAIYIALYDSNRKRNSFQFLQFNSGTSRGGVFAAAGSQPGRPRTLPSTNSPLLTHQLTNLCTEVILRTPQTTPVKLSKPFKSELTGGAKVCLFLENTQYHLFFLCGKYAGRLLVNKQVGGSVDDEIYAYLSPDANSLLLYGWNICHELKVSL